MEYLTMKVADLKKELIKRNLSTIGNKNELIERLEQNDDTIKPDDDMLELSFKTLMGSYHTVFIKKDRTLQELLSELAKKLNTENNKIRLYHIIDSNNYSEIGDLVYTNGTIGKRMHDGMNNKTMDKLNIINGSMFEVSVKLF